jgi:hypothetical protein
MGAVMVRRLPIAKGLSADMDLPAGKARSRDRALRWTIVVLAVAQGVLFLVVLRQTLIRAPFEDMLQWLDAYERYRHGGDLDTYLLGFFQEHRLIWAKLLTAIDASVFRSNGTAFIAAGLASLAGVTILLTREFRVGLPSGGPLAALVWLCPMLILTTANAVDCSVPVNIVYPLTLLFVAGACVLVTGPAEAGPMPRWRGFAAMALAAGAGFANAVGLLAWPVLLWSAWRCRTGKVWVVAIAVGTAVYGMAYLHGIVLTSGGAPRPDTTVAQLTKEAAYLLAYLGLPLSRVPGLRLAGEVLGAALLGAAVLAFIRFGVLGPAITRLERISVSLIMFSLGAAILAAVGRSHFTAEIEIPVRYTVLVTPLHVGLLAIVLRWVADHPGVECKSGLLLGGGVAAALLLLAQQAVGALVAIQAADIMRSRIDRFYAGERDPDIQRLVFQSGLSRAAEIVAALRRDGLLDR